MFICLYVFMILYDLKGALLCKIFAWLRNCHAPALCRHLGNYLCLNVALRNAFFYPLLLGEFNLKAPFNLMSADITK